MVGGRLRDRARSDSALFCGDRLGSRRHREGMARTVATSFFSPYCRRISFAASPAAAQQAVSVVASPSSVDLTNDNNCTFLLGHCAQITTSDKDASIHFANSGNFNAGLNGIYTTTTGLTAPITIENAGDIKALSHGIAAIVNGGGSDLLLNNTGRISSGGDGINALIFSFGGRGQPCVG